MDEVGCSSAYVELELEVSEPSWDELCWVWRFGVGIEGRKWVGQVLSVRHRRLFERVKLRIY